MSKNELSHAEMGDFRPQGKSEMRPAEKLLWELVRDRGMGVEFFWRRKVDQYVLNFFCEEGKLVIDLQPADGSAEEVVYDVHRTLFLEINGYTVLSFMDEELYRDGGSSPFDKIAEALSQKGAACKKPTPEQIASARRRFPLNDGSKARKEEEKRKRYLASQNLSPSVMKAMTPARRFVWELLRAERLGQVFVYAPAVGKLRADFGCESARLLLNVRPKADAKAAEADLALARASGMEIIEATDEELQNAPFDFFIRVVDCLRSKNLTCKLPTAFEIEKALTQFPIVAGQQAVARFSAPKAAEPAAAAEPKVEAKAGRRLEAQAKPEAGPRAEPQAGSKAEPKVEPKAGASAAAFQNKETQGKSDARAASASEAPGAPAAEAGGSNDALAADSEEGDVLELDFSAPSDDGARADANVSAASSGSGGSGGAVPDAPQPSTRKAAVWPEEEIEDLFASDPESESKSKSESKDSRGGISGPGAVDIAALFIDAKDDARLRAVPPESRLFDVTETASEPGPASGREAPSKAAGDEGREEFSLEELDVSEEDEKKLDAARKRLASGKQGQASGAEAKAEEEPKHELSEERDDDIFGGLDFSLFTVPGKDKAEGEEGLGVGVALFADELISDDEAGSHGAAASAAPEAAAESARPDQQGLRGRQDRQGQPSQQGQQEGQGGQGEFAELDSLFDDADAEVYALDDDLDVMFVEGDEEIDQLLAQATRSDAQAADEADASGEPGAGSGPSDSALASEPEFQGEFENEILVPTRNVPGAQNVAPGKFDAASAPKPTPEARAVDGLGGADEADMFGDVEVDLGEDSGFGGIAADLAEPEAKSAAPDELEPGSMDKPEAPVGLDDDHEEQGGQSEQNEQNEQSIDLGDAFDFDGEIEVEESDEGSPTAGEPSAAAGAPAAVEPGDSVVSVATEPAQDDVFVTIVEDEEDALEGFEGETLEEARAPDSGAPDALTASAESDSELGLESEFDLDLESDLEPEPEGRGGAAEPDRDDVAVGPEDEDLGFEIDVGASEIEVVAGSAATEPLGEARAHAEGEAAQSPVFASDAFAAAAAEGASEADSAELEIQEGAGEEAEEGDRKELVSFMGDRAASQASAGAARALDEDLAQARSLSGETALRAYEGFGGVVEEDAHWESRFESNPEVAAAANKIAELVGSGEGKAIDPAETLRAGPVQAEPDLPASAPVSAAAAAKALEEQPSGGVEEFFDLYFEDDGGVIANRLNVEPERDGAAQASPAEAEKEEAEAEKEEAEAEKEEAEAEKEEAEAEKEEAEAEKEEAEAEKEEAEAEKEEAEAEKEEAEAEKEEAEAEKEEPASADQRELLELRRQAALLEAEKAKALEEKAKAEAELAAAEAEKAAAIALKEEAEALAKAAREEARSEAPAGREDVESMLRGKLGQSDGEAGAPSDAYAPVLDRLGGGLGGRIFSAGPEKPIDKPFLPEPEPIMPSDGPGAEPFDLFAQPAVALVSAPAADSAAESEGAAEGGLSKRQKAQLDLQNWLASKGKKKERAEKREETEEERQKREREEAYMLAEARQSVGRPELDPDFYDPVKKSQVLTKDFSEKRARSMAEFDQSAASSADDKTAAAAAPAEEGVKTIVLEGDIAVPIYDSSVAPSPFLEIPTPNLEGSGMDLTRHSSELADALSFEESLRATRPETAAEGSEESSGAGEAEPQAAEAEKIGVEGGDEKKTGDLEAPSPLPTGRNLPKLQDLEVEGGLLARLDKMKERIDQDKQRKAGKHEAEAHDALEREAREREAQERAALEREAQERAAREREAQERAAREREAQERAAREREAQEREAREREAQEREAREREAQERAAREREAQERAALEREAQERAALEREAQEREALEREAQEREAEAKAAAVEALGASERFGAGSAEGLGQASADRREIEGYVLKPEKSAARILKVMPTAHRRTEFGPIRGAMDQDLPRLFSNARVLVVGDVMLDRYWFGEADSIAPEAPVPVTRIEKIERRPGGAANVARNIAELGGHAQLIAAVGDDEAGRELAELLRRASIDAKLTVDASIATTIKLRVVSRNQQMIRLDFDNAPAAETLGALMDDFRAALPRCDVVVLSDYGKGALRRVNEMVEAARAAGKPALIDPKGVDFLKYRGATVVMPNRRELKEIVGEWEDELDLADKANQLRRSLQCDKLLMTRGSEGLSLFKESRAINQPTIAREVYDASGAGDTVSAMMALGMAAGLDDVECMKIANAAAGVVIGKLGSSVCALRELMERKPLNSLA